MSDAESRAGNAALARALIEKLRTACLATTRAEDHWPYSSLVLTVPGQDGAPLLLLSALAEHTRNIAGDPRVALLYDGTRDHAEPLSGPRLTLLGEAFPCAAEEARQAFLSAHPSATAYVDFKDFSFYRIAPVRGHLVAGFGQIMWLSSAEIIRSGLPNR